MVVQWPQAIAMVPRTCQTTLGKTAVSQHDPIIAEAKRMLPGLEMEVREFLYEAARDNAQPFQLPEAGTLVQYGQCFFVMDIVQLQQGGNGRRGDDGITTSAQLPLFPKAYFKVAGFSKDQAAAEDETSSRAQQTYKCILEPLHARHSRIHVILGGELNLRLKTLTNKDVTAKKIENALPTRIAWQGPTEQVRRQLMLSSEPLKQCCTQAWARSMSCRHHAGARMATASR